MKRLPFIIISLILLFACGRKHDASPQHVENNSFFGDSVVTILSSNQPNGYSISILRNKELCLWHFQRGDSISRYLAINCVPDDMATSIQDSIGTFTRSFDIPTRDKLPKDLNFHQVFFMDVNFDGETDLVVPYVGYNRTHYVCFDIVHGDDNVTFGILQPMNEPPFNNIVSGAEDIYTEFDYDKKTIHISEQLGCCSHVESWSEMIQDYEFDTPKVRIVRKEKVEYINGYEYRTNYKRIDGDLKEISTTREKI